MPCRDIDRTPHRGARISTYPTGHHIGAIVGVFLRASAILVSKNDWVRRLLAHALDFPLGNRYANHAHPTLEDGKLFVRRALGVELCGCGPDYLILAQHPAFRKRNAEV